MTDQVLDPADTPRRPVAAPTVAEAPAPASVTGEDGEVDWPRLFLGFGGMVVGYFMAVLDIQIVAASLSQIQAGVGASSDQISWIQTIYLLAEVVIIPLTAYLTRMFGTRRSHHGEQYLVGKAGKIFDGELKQHGAISQQDSSRLSALCEKFSR